VIAVPPEAAAPGVLMPDPPAAKAVGAAVSASASVAGIISRETRKVLVSLVGLRG
jgi:hypothetical protein